MVSKYKLICFDFSGVLVDGNGWIDLHKYYDVYKVSREQMQMYLDGKINYQQWCEMNVDLWKQKDATKSEIKRALEKAMKPFEKARETIKSLKQKGFRLALISGDLDIAFDLYFDRSDFDDIFISKLIFDDQDRLIGINPTEYDFENKLSALANICKRETISAKEIIAVVNDGHGNDIDLAKAAGLVIAVNSDSKQLLDMADYKVDYIAEIDALEELRQKTI